MFVLVSSSFSNFFLRRFHHISAAVVQGVSQLVKHDSTLKNESKRKSEIEAFVLDYYLLFYYLLIYFLF